MRSMKWLLAALILTGVRRLRRYAYGFRPGEPDR